MEIGGPSMSRGDRIAKRLKRLEIPEECGVLFTYLESHKDVAAEGGGVCGHVWPLLDIRYKCVTCQITTTCAICASCFEGGNHRKDGHDYRTVYSAGGCCDCGDSTAMKPDGFCSKHKGVEKIQVPRSEMSSMIGPALDRLLRFLKDRLFFDHISQRPVLVSEDLASELVELFIGLCGLNLAYISEKILSLNGFLRTLVRVEGTVAGILKKLLFKLLGEPNFKEKFAQEFLLYYPTVVSNAVTENAVTVKKTEEEENKVTKHTDDKATKLMLFSAQIFVLPTLTLRLVKENDLFSMLSKCLEDIFESCAGVDGTLEIEQWRCIYSITIRVVEDIKFAMSHSAVPIYVARNQQDVTRWMRILKFVQGTNPQQIKTSLCIWKEPSRLGHYLGRIHSCLVRGAFSEEIKNDSGQDLEDLDSGRPGKIAKVSMDLSTTPSISLLTLECLKAIDGWLERVHTSRQPSSSVSSGEGGSGSSESLKVLGLREWPEIVYDVRSQAISVHIPLHRLMCMILERSIETGNWNATSGGLLSTTSEHFFSNILGGSSLYGFSGHLMEHPLQIRVLCAQLKSGMRPKNEDAESYYSYPWYDNGIEHDLFMLQLCAAVAPEADLYVKRILDRYDLMKYLNPDLDLSSQHESVLVEEMLTLLIQIVKERRFCGLTTAACLRRGLIYKLAIEDATYSELHSSVPKDILVNADFQETLDSVAVTNQDKYILRTECWKDLDLYYVRCDSYELQKAENRYLRFCGATDLIPKWSTVFQPLNGIARIATCKTTLEIVRTVLYHAVISDQSKTSRASNCALLRALHLIYLALDIWLQQRAPGQKSEGIPILEFASEENSSINHSDRCLLSLLVTLMRRHVTEKNENLAEAMNSNISLCDGILRKFAELDLKCLFKLQKLAPEIFNQPTDDNVVGLDSHSEERKAKALQKQAAVLEEMKNQQNKYLKSKEADVLHGGDVKLEENKLVCSVCRDSNSKIPVCFLIHLQKSRLLSFLDKGPVSWISPSGPSDILTYDGFSPPYCDGIYVSSCGHAAHQDCIAKYEGSFWNRGREVVDRAKMEFVCPVCRAIYSSVLPIPNSTASDPGISSASSSASSSSSSSTRVDSLQIQQAISLMEHAALIPLEQFRSQTLNLDSLCRAVCRWYFPVEVDEENEEYEDAMFESGMACHPVLLWDVLKYSITCSEIAERSEKSLSTQVSGSDTLQIQLKPSASMLSLFLNIVQGSKAENMHASTIRSRGLQLFVNSLCLGSSTDDQHLQEGGDMAGARVPDAEIWTRISDPILGHDSFSSMMWAIFCLPASLLSCENSFFCLVHIFYLVTITQALVICCRKRRPTFVDCRFSDICEFIWDRRVHLRHLDSRYIDDSCGDFKDAIRCLTCPFLRRCSYLWYLVSSKAESKLSSPGPGSSSWMESNIQEVQRLESMFKIPGVDEILNDETSHVIVTRWLNHYLSVFRHGRHDRIYCNPAIPYSLVALPELHEPLLFRYNKILCTVCDRLLDCQSICLFCGELCAPDCKRDPEEPEEPERPERPETERPEKRCEIHALMCGAGTGVFLMIQSASIVLHREGWESAWPSLYLNKHGEEEDGMYLPGCPLTLHKERYAVLAHIVASHGLNKLSNMDWSFKFKDEPDPLTSDL